jgi:hypothetical protein
MSLWREMTVRNARNICAMMLAVVVSVGAALAASAPASAAIACKNGYQRVQGNDIATPYCQDAYLAQVARSFGVRTSAETIRSNPNAKREVCRLVGRDIRVSSICVDEGPFGRGGRF